MSHTPGAAAALSRRSVLLGGRGVAVAALTALVAAFAPATASLADEHDDAPGWERIAGDDRYETAADIATDTYPDGADTVIVTTGGQFPDALAGNYAAGVEDAPVLLTRPDDVVPQTTLDALDELNASDVIIIGGTAAVTPAAEATISDAGYDVQRVEGATRYETAAEVALHGDVDRDTAIVATGENFPDALAMGSIAFSEQYPLLLTRTDFLSDAAGDALEALDVDQVLVAGGPVAVSDNTVEDIEGIVGEGSVVRLDGEARTETAIEIAEYAVDELGYSLEHLNYARGNLFADALATGPHAGNEQAPILLTWTESQLDWQGTGATADHNEDFLRANCEVIAGGHLAGGPEAITPDVADDIAAAATCPTGERDLTVDSTDGGTVTDPGEGTFTYDVGATVDLVAEAEEGYEFAGWTGDTGTIADSAAATTTITMDADASITATFNEEGVEDPLFTPGDFTMFVESGSVVIGTDAADPYVIEFSECPDGTPAEEGEECITFEGEIDADGNFTVEPDDVFFPTLEVRDDPDTPLDLDANTGVSAPITGNIDPDTGEATFDLPMQVDLDLGPNGTNDCRIVVDLDGTSGTSGDLTGSPLGEDGRLTFVENDFAVPATESLSQTGDIACGQVDGAVGVPTDPGENTAEFNLLLVQNGG